MQPLRLIRRYAKLLRSLHVQTARTKTYRLFPECTEPTFKINNYGHYSPTEGNKSSFSMSGHAIYSPTDIAVASATSVSWIRRDLPRMRFELVSEYSACTVERLHASTKFLLLALSSFYTLVLHSFCGFAPPCCRAMSVKTVHGHEFLIFLHFCLGLTLM